MYVAQWYEGIFRGVTIVVGPESNPWCNPNELVHQWISSRTEVINVSNSGTGAYSEAFYNVTVRLFHGIIKLYINLWCYST